MTAAQSATASALAEAPTAAVSNREMLAVHSPANGDLVGKVPVFTREDVGDTVARCRDAQTGWAALAFSQRGRILKRYRDFLIDAKDEIADTLCAESGKPRAEAYGIEMMYVCDAIGYWAKNAARLLADREARPHLLKTKKAYSTYKPRGVIGMITPWNYPLILSIGEAIPALMAGNGVVIKPSSTTPLVTVLACRIAHEAGMPEGLLATVTGSGRVGWDLIDFVDMVSFTGSVETGRKIQIKCAEQLKPTTMELGGKDPMIVCRDANVERAANGCVWGSLTNSGQVCISIERVYVDAKIYDDFVGRVLDKVGKIRQDLPDRDADIGCMTARAQVEVVAEQVADAIARGAKVLAGGKKVEGRDGQWYEPTVLTDVTDDMRIMREETFGPVIAIRKVDNEAEALALANDSDFGLSASVWSRDTAGAINIARRLESGAVCVNDHMIHMMIPEVPMGGVKESGIGRRHGAEGIRKYCHQQTIVVDRFGLAKEPVWYPSMQGREKLFRRALNVLFRSGWRHKLQA
jgi:acyl-CoA reductase-like NAD-dependent aldehyde dehydrogenase